MQAQSEMHRNCGIAIPFGIRPFRRLGMLVFVLLFPLLLGGCARKPPKPAYPPAPPYDPVALAAKSQELARELGQRKPPETANEYVIGPTDILEVSVFEFPKYSVTARVGGDGAIRFPDLGVVKVAGLSERQAENLIQKMLEEKELVLKPQVMVFVKELHAREVTITGDVKLPGVYPIRGHEALIDLISKAGGLSSTAGSYAYILRQQQATSQTQEQHAAITESNNLKVDLVALLMRGENQWNIPLQAGDRVTIPPVGWVHVTGRGVEKAGTYMLRTAPNLLRQSIDDAGGLKFAADYNLTIIRRSPDGRQEAFYVNYKDILRDEHNDITLQGGDTVIVNSTAMKTTLAAIGKGAEKIFRFSVGGYLPIFGNTYGGGY